MDNTTQGTQIGSALNAGSQANDSMPSYGASAVGLTFNPANDPDVQEVKELYAKIINKCNDMRAKAGLGEKSRLFSVAITEAQTAQMWAVKAITWK